MARVIPSTVLIIDDDPAVCRSTATVLKALGCTSLVAESHSAGLALFRANPDTSVILLDYHVGVSTPEQIVEKLRALKPKIHIIGASGNDRRKEFSALGVERFLAKPWGISDLERVLCES